MPNWCANVLIAKHKDKDKMEALKSALKSTKFFEYILPIGEWEYEKACSTWGTKWEASNLNWCLFTATARHHLDISFDSAWCPPEGVYQTMANDGWEITAYFYEPGMGFVGKYGVDSSGLYEESYNIEDEPIPAELVEMFNIEDMYDGTECELVDNGDGHYIVKERIDDAD